ncbi:site-2 protease family protein, partial [Candidatus Peregrinibacteria bacterium]|nr:site-2 protease family protein [Candidatus Peregrinibacteria bacterium]
MTVIISSLAFILLLSLLILIHEWGHFAAARKFGVEVEEFGFGLPPRAKTLFSRAGTDFTLNWIPFGGFVRLKGENALTERERRSPGSFSAASIPSRIVILLAGVFMNLVLAVALLTVGFSVGRWVPTFMTFEEMEQASTRGEIHLVMGVLIDEVMSSGGAAKAGIPAKSLLRSINGLPVTRLEDVLKIQEGKTRVTYEVSRVTGRSVSDTVEEFSVTLAQGKSGVSVVPFALELSAPAHSVVQAFLLAMREARIMTVQTVIGIGNLFSSLAMTGTVPEGIAGIVGIAQLTHVSVQEGFMHYLRLVA